MEKQPVISPKFLLSTSAESRMLDESTIHDFGIDGFTLMEIAALNAASFIREHEGDSQQGLFICGKGNNGGDALAVARYLTDRANHHVTVYMVFGDTGLSEDAHQNLSLLRKLQKKGANITFVEQLASRDVESCHYIVDGILGTGLTSKLRDPISGLVELINSASAHTYAMDIPTGLSADTGFALGGAVKADTTLSFGTQKLGFYINEGSQYTGNVKFIDLPFPRYLYPSQTILLDTELQSVYPKKPRNAAHKYQQGVVHILAGSEGLTGAAIMAAKSAWKQGAGAVFLYTPKKLLPVYESALPHIIKIPVGDNNDGFYKPEHTGEILKQMNQKKGVLLAGPGIGTRDQTGACIEQVLKEQTEHALLDADALSFWKRLEKISDKQKWILTPHIGEANKYLDAKSTDDNERLEWAKSFSKTHHCLILSKGKPTLFSTADGRAFITSYDTQIFARAGFGDVLSGTISTNLAITGLETTSLIHALCDGISTYQNLPHTYPFGPEHLL